MKKLEYTKFGHKKPFYTQFHERSLAVVSCDIELYNNINLITKVMILYAISKRLVTNDSQLKIIIPAGTYSINQFNKKIKVSKPMWVSPQIKDDYKLVIPEHHTFVASALLFKTLGIKANFLPKTKSLLTKGKYQTNLKPPPKKFTLHFKEIDKFHNEKDSQPFTQLFSLDVDNNAVHYTSPLTYFSLSSSSPHNRLHFTLLDENQKKVIPNTFNLVLLYSKKHECIQ